MTVQNDIMRITHDTDGAVKDFSFNFKIFEVADLVVSWVDSSGDSGSVGSYTVSGVGNSQGGIVHLAAAPANGGVLTITRMLPLTQKIDLSNQSQFYPSSMEEGLDRQTMIQIQIQDQLSRTITMPPGSEASLEFPTPTGSDLIGWSADGTHLQNYPPGGGGMANPMTGAGDMIVGGVDGAPERIAAGAEGQIPTVQSDGTVEFQDPAPQPSKLPWWDPNPVPPLSGDFTWTNGAGVDLTGALQVRGDGPGTVGLKEGSISNPVDVTAMIAAMLTDPGTAGARVGIAGVNQAGDALIFFGLALIAGALTLQVETFAFPAMTSSAVAWSVPLGCPSCPVKLAMHLPEDSGSNTFSVSLGDSSLIQVYSESTATLGAFSAQVGLVSIGDAGTVANVADWE